MWRRWNNLMLVVPAAAMAVAMVLSDRRPLRAEFTTDAPRRVQLESEAGWAGLVVRRSVGWFPVLPSQDERPDRLWSQSEVTNVPVAWHAGAVVTMPVTNGSRAATFRAWRVRWVVLLVAYTAIALPVLLRRTYAEAVARRAAERRRRRLCVACGYDLRASGGRRRCPECGAASEAVVGDAATAATTGSGMSK